MSREDMMDMVIVTYGFENDKVINFCALCETDADEATIVRAFVEVFR